MPLCLDFLIITIILLALPCGFLPIPVDASIPKTPLFPLAQCLLSAVRVVLVMGVLSLWLLVTKEVAPPAARVVHLIGWPSALRRPHFLHGHRHRFKPSSWVEMGDRLILSLIPLQNELEPQQKIKSQTLAPPPTPVSHPFVEQTVKFIAHPPELAAIFLGCPQGRWSWLGPSPEWNSISGGTSVLFPLSLELLLSGDRQC